MQAYVGHVAVKTEKNEVKKMSFCRNLKCIVAVPNCRFFLSDSVGGPWINGACNPLEGLLVVCDYKTNIRKTLFY